jgi:hypothetical protein
MTATSSAVRKLIAISATVVALTAIMVAAPSAVGQIGLEGVDVTNLDRNGDPVIQAGSHPNANATSFELEYIIHQLGPFPITVPFPTESIKTAITRLPPGFVGNPLATPKCSAAQFAQPLSNLIFETCRPEAQIGYVRLTLGGLFSAFVGGDPKVSYLPVYNLETPPGTPALFGFSVLGTPGYLTFTTRTGDDYGLTATSANIPTTADILSVQFVLWGVPADPIHDEERGYDGVLSCVDVEYTQRSLCKGHTSEAPLRSFLTMPTSCVGPGPNNSVETTFAADSWDDIGAFSAETTFSHDNTEPEPNPIGFSGCNAVPFEPSIEARPTTNVADSASGLDVNLHLPVHDGCTEEGSGVVNCELAEAHLKDATVDLPEGLTINPAAANGLDGCSEAEFGYTDTGEDGMIHTTPDPASCPDNSKQGTVTIETPLLDHPLKGSVYLADPYANPFGSLVALYIAVDDPKTGTVIKLAGEASIDQSTGRISTTFKQNPQLPFEDFRLHFFGGAGGPLRTPATCGTYATTSSMTPWTYPDSGPPAAPSDSWAIETAPGGGSCPTTDGARHNSPDLDAGSVSPVAGISTPTIVNLRRDDGTQEFAQVKLTLPPGLTGRLAGIEQCSDAALASAASKSGREEEASPSCPSGSRIGRVEVGAGAGPAPYYAKGTAYLTGPYKGAPLSMAIVTPATAGPFDLGTVVVRVALYLDRNSAQITAVSDRIPRILQGIPLDVRSTKITLDRENFTRNGTSCDPSSFEGSLISTLANTASLSERFQLGECSALGFKPKLAIRLFGGTKRGAHPALRASLRMPDGGANIGRAVVALPHSEFLDQAHIGTVCTRVQYAAHECPAASVYGNVVVTSPLVDYPLEGPAILRSSDHTLPDLVLALHGPPSQPVEVDAVGRIDSGKGGGIRTTFEGTPDIPVSTLVLNMAGGKKGLLQNSTNTCKAKNKATAQFDGQNGKASDFKVLLRNGKCGKSGKAKKRKAAHRHAR